MDVEIYQYLSSIFGENHTIFFSLNLFVSQSLVAENRKGLKTGNQGVLNEWRAE